MKRTLIGAGLTALITAIPFAIKWWRNRQEEQWKLNDYGEGDDITDDSNEYVKRVHDQPTDRNGLAPQDWPLSAAPGNRWWRSHCFVCGAEFDGPEHVNVCWLHSKRRIPITVHDAHD